MEIRWVPYNGVAESIQNDLEMLMLFSGETGGVTIRDIYRYLADISLVYAKLCSYKTGELTSEIIVEIYRKNKGFYEATLRNVFEDKHHIGLLKIEELLRDFRVPDID